MEKSLKKNVVLGVTGSIAAYKACEIVSKLKKNPEINVDVIMTKSAQKLVGEISFQSLSKNPVNTDTFQEVKYWEISHIELAKKANIFLIAPATANIIGKIANGIADDMLSTTAMATTSQIVVAPAMNTNMYYNPANIENMEKLKKRGVIFIEPEDGMLACEDIGKGKLADTDKITELVTSLLYKTDELKGKKILITAGPTKEDIDPVRFLSNNSSGKMGYALAKEGVMRSADVTLVSGETNLSVPVGIKEFVQIRSAKDMYEEVIKRYNDFDIVIKSAAVADFTPAEIQKQKIKKSDKDLTISLVRTKDILREIGEKKENQILVGFAAETEEIEKNALQKLESKNLDMIVLNDVLRKDIAFKSEENEITIFTRNNKKFNIPKASKDIIASKIYNVIIEELL